jgi:hypothetical protein
LSFKSPFLENADGFRLTWCVYSKTALPTIEHEKSKQQRPTSPPYSRALGRPCLSISLIHHGLEAELKLAAGVIDDDRS